MTVSCYMGREVKVTGGVIIVKELTLRWKAILDYCVTDCPIQYPGFFWGEGGGRRGRS